MAFGFSNALRGGMEDEVDGERRPGRPRKWANDAERARQYRRRKAAEQADVDALRRDRRELRQQLANAEDERDRLRRELDSAGLRARRAEEAARLADGARAAAMDRRQHVEQRVLELSARAGRSRE